MTNRELYTLTSALSIIDKTELLGKNPSLDKIRSFVDNINKKEKQKKENLLSNYKKLENNIFLLKTKKTNLDLESYEVIHIHKILDLNQIFIKNENENAIELEYTKLVLFSFGSFSKFAINEKEISSISCKAIDSLIALNAETLKKILDLQDLEFKTHENFLKLVKKIK